MVESFQQTVFDYQRGSVVLALESLDKRFLNHEE
jgi:hypothetical protein